MSQQFITSSKKKISTQIINLTGDIGWSIVFGFPLLLAGLILIAIPERYQAEVDFRSRALLTTGIVMETKEHQSCYSSGYGSSCRTECDMRVKFKSNTGNSAMFWESCSVNANKNQLISVLYDPKEIRRSRIFYQSDTPKKRATGELIVSLFLTAIPLFYLFLCKEDLKRS
jgi:hypothetical protein